MEPTHLPYYHPEISSPDGAKIYLLDHMEHGSFILRRSTKEKQYTLSIVYSEKMIHHVTIQRNDSKFYLVSNQEFDSIDQLVSFYKSSDIPNTKYESLRLVHGIGVEKTAPPPRPPKPIRNKSSTVDDTSLLLPHSDNKSELKNVASYNFCDHQRENYPPRPSEPKPPMNVPANSHHMKPLPLPSESTAVSCSLLSNYIKSHEDDSYYSTHYSRVDTGQKDRTHELIKMLDELDQLELQTLRCECGIYHKDSQLPDGWTVHRSQDPGTEGQLFFTSSDGVTTSWTLPDKVWYKLAPEHVEILTQLAKQNDVPLPAPVKYLQSRQF